MQAVSLAALDLLRSSRDPGIRKLLNRLGELTPQRMPLHCV